MTKEYVGTYTFDGNVYGFPTLRDYSEFAGITMRTDILEELNLVEQAKAMKTWSDYEEILKIVYENVTAKGGMAAIGMSYPYGSYLYNENDNFADSHAIDILGDALSIIYGDQETGEVKLVMKSDGYKFGMEYANKWWDAGYYWADSPITTEFVDDAMAQHLFFSQIHSAENGIEVAKEGAMGFDLTFVKVNNGMVRTEQPVFTGICVPVTCEEPEAAVAFINELYTNAELMNVLVWGVEGRDYTLENNQVVHNPDDGYIGVDFVWGNNFLLKAEFGQSADFYEIAQRNNKESAISAFMGFALDTADMDLLLSQLTTVTDEYAKIIPYGGMDQLDEYISALETAGVNDYIDAIQKQLDAWSAAQ